MNLILISLMRMRISRSSRSFDVGGRLFGLRPFEIQFHHKDAKITKKTELKVLVLLTETVLRCYAEGVLVSSRGWRRLYDDTPGAIAHGTGSLKDCSYWRFVAQILRAVYQTALLRHIVSGGDARRASLHPRLLMSTPSA